MKNTLVKSCILLLPAFMFTSFANAQTPVVIASQTNLTYTENFNDVSNWTFGTGGLFSAGIGSAAWQGLAVGGSGSVPDANVITTATSSSFASSSSGGLRKGTGNLDLLSTGTTNNTSSAAIDFFLDYTGALAGTLSFDAATVFNSTGNRVGSLKVYASVNGTTWTELTGTNLPYAATNNAAGSASITTVTLPSSFDNSATARLRFYYHNGSGGSSGSRPRISFDNIVVTSAGLMPVKLVSFEGSLKNNTVSLAWATAQELNNSHFEIERSSNGKDFEKIGAAMGSGNSTTLINYRFNDESAPAANSIYYRLKQVDFDGRFECSKTIVIARKNSLSGDAVISPNPLGSNSTVSYTLDNAASVSIAIYDMSGRLVAWVKENEMQQAGEQSVALPLLSKGLYLVKVITGTEHVAKRVIAE